MAGKPIGELSFVLTAHSGQAVGEIRKLAKAAGDIERSSSSRPVKPPVLKRDFSELYDGVKKTDKEMARLSNRTQQFGFLVDDAFTGYAARGFSGAIQAAANNATMLAMQIGPMAGLITVGVMAAAQLATKFWGAKKEVEETNEELDTQGHMLRMITSELEAQQRIAGRRIEFGEFLGGENQARDFQARRKSTEKELRDLRNTIAIEEAKINATIEQAFEERRNNTERKPGDSPFFDPIREREIARAEVFATPEGAEGLQTIKNARNEIGLLKRESGQLETLEVDAQLSEDLEFLRSVQRLDVDTDGAEGKIHALFDRYEKELKRAREIADPVMQQSAFSQLESLFNREVDRIIQDSRVKPDFNQVKTQGAVEFGSSAEFSAFNRSIQQNRSDGQALKAAATETAKNTKKAADATQKLLNSFRVVG